MRLYFKQLINKSIILGLIAIFLITIQSTVYADNLQKEIEVIEKLYKDGVLTKEEFEKTKKILIRNAEKKKRDQKKETDLKVKKSDIKPSDIRVNIESKPNSKEFEKAEIIFKDYKIYTFRPGGIKVKRISDGRQLLTIVDNFKVKYYNNSQNIINVDYSEIKRPALEKQTQHRVDQAKKKVNQIFNVLKKPGESLKQYGEKVKKTLKTKDIDHIKFKKDLQSLIPKESIKLKLNIEGTTVLTAEGRYVNHHDVFFYQFLTTTYEPFHYYIKLRKKPSIALNMNFFNKRVDRAVRKAKERLAKEHNITIQEIDRIIEDRIARETDDAINRSVEDAVNESVAAAIEESVGMAMAEQLTLAIEQATGEAIDRALTAELGAAIDAEIARAVEMGIDEAAVTAGWEAYFEVIGAGGTAEEAAAAAYDACGSACDNY
ncbi:hypothetical protein OAI51_02525 [Candidatus Pelagibacter bacterium]|nr:hypothetical protein [Candidatus Pelagibacter bacterium]